ncbi:MAG TPA: hypothetical protein VGB51_01730 [Actinomycetota bacterium]
MDSAAGTATTPARPTLPAILTMAGGLLVAAAGFLDWFDLTSAGGTVAIKGNEFSVGIGASAIGVFTAISGVIMLLRGPETGAKAWSVTVIVLAAILTVVGGASAFAPETAITQYAAGDVGETLGISETAAKAALENAFATGTLSATAKIGSYLVLAGALSALGGGIAGVAFAKRRRASKAAPPPVAPPSPATPPPATPPPA